MTNPAEALRIITTSDGSHSLIHSGLNETYHSVHGAITESRHVFIEHGLKVAASQAPHTLEILEVGFGTGLNVFLTALEQPSLNLTIRYTTLEPNPVSMEILRQLNYASLLDADQALFNQIHDASWSEWQPISSGFSLLKLKETLQAFAPTGHFDVIYFDAFAPSRQPEVWEPSLFRKLAASLNPGGIFVTYAATGNLRRALKEAGLVVEKLPGAPGKREMTRAMKSVR